MHKLVNCFTLCIPLLLLQLMIACSTEKPSKVSSNPFPMIDSLLATQRPHTFNGIIFIASEKDTFVRMQGYADRAEQTRFNRDHQFVIGSISKQITAALILLEYEKGSINLATTIGHYLPDLEMPWRDSVTVHDLLAHTHGIVAKDQPLAFKPGAQFQYSQLGYQLLAEILEQINQQSFAALSKTFFERHQLNYTTHPDHNNRPLLVQGYTEITNDSIVLEHNSFENYVPAGCFISNVKDLVKWNTWLYEQQLLNDTTLNLMTQKHATRAHPIWGELNYGYGITFKPTEKGKRMGALGFAPGFVSSNFYFPKSKTSVVILENIAQNLPNFRETFSYHTRILDLVKAELKARGEY